MCITIKVFYFIINNKVDVDIDNSRHLKIFYKNY